MGTSSSSAADYRARAAYRASSGTSFAYTSTMASTPVGARKIHESVDPRRKNSLGEQVRECLDSTEHPLTIPVFVGFDETGSMGHGPRLIQEKLATLKGLTLRAGLPDVQLCFGAYGDAQNGEVAPCQVGQFESGLEMEEWLNNLYLEGNGGGNGGETAGLLLYFLANYSRLDSLDKRGKKGYIFLTGDEIALDVTRQEIKTYLDEDVESNFTMHQVIDMVNKSYEVFFFLVENGSARAQGSLAFWTDLLGVQNVIVVEDLENVSELISGILAVEEGVVSSLDEVGDMLAAEGSSSKSIMVVNSTLAGRAPSTISNATVVTGTTDLPRSTTAAGADFL